MALSSACIVVQRINYKGAERPATRNREIYTHLANVVRMDCTLQDYTLSHRSTLNMETPISVLSFHGKWAACFGQLGCSWIPEAII